MARVKIDNYAYAAAPRLGPTGWLRWIWRQVTSMRVALILLLLLALASIPGSVLPQWPQDARTTRDFIDANPFWGGLLDTLGFLDVFGSAWFTAIYVLLFASLIGCIVPRCGVYWRELRAPVPAAPSRLDRYQPVLTEVAPQGARVVIPQAARVLSPEVTEAQPGGTRWNRPRWWRWLFDYRVRIDRRDRQRDDAPEEMALSAHRGHVRELGNLLFHVSLVAILLAVGAGALLTYRGQALIVEGDTFTNAVVAYDTYESGALYDPADLDPWTLRLDEFHAQFELSGRAQSFTAVTTLTEPGGEPRTVEAEVNRPIQVDGAKVYLMGNGYAPHVTVTDSAGEIAFDGAVPFLPQDDVYTSTGVIKVPDVTEGDQLGFKATLLPSAVTDGETSMSIHPDPSNPVIYLQPYTGDLGLDDGLPQNVYQLDESRLSPVRDEQGDPAVLEISLGETIELPDGLGTIAWETMPRYAAFDLRRDPSLPWLLTASLTSMLGLAMSLFGSRRRIWVVAALSPHDGRKTTVVEAAGWAPPHDAGVADEVQRVFDKALGRLTVEDR